MEASEDVDTKSAGVADFLATMDLLSMVVAMAP
jgi:hypothetical protein